MPFPTSLVTDITEADIEFLASSYDLDPPHGFSMWADVFLSINIAFLDNLPSPIGNMNAHARQRILSALSALQALGAAPP